MAKRTPIVVRFDGSPLSREQILKGYKGIKEAYTKITLMPEKKRRTKETRDTLVRLAMLEGLLSFFEKELDKPNLKGMYSS